MIWATAATVCIAVAIWLSLDHFLTDRYAVSFEPRYVTPTAFDPDTALLLKQDENANTLLITARSRPEVFKYDSNRQVTRIASGEWSSSGATEIDCGQQLALEEYSGEYYGQFLLSARSSLDHQFIAVLSAYGPRAPEIEILPNLGGSGRILGTRYLELRRSPDNERIGRPIRINLQSDVIQPSLCWTPSARYLVVHDQANSISVVDFQNR